MEKELLRQKAKTMIWDYNLEEMCRQCYSLGKDILPNKVAAFFYPLSRSEPDLYLLAEETRKRGRSLYPRIEKERLVFVEVKNVADFTPGSFGIMEPKGDVCQQEIELIFVPGVFFTKDGRRLGRGKGFYDRYLAEYSGVKVGVCFEQCIQEYLPEDEHDIKMDFILTERSLIHCYAL